MPQTAEYWKLYRQRNKEKIRAHNKNYYLKNKDHVLSTGKIWRNNNREKMAELNKAWKARHPEKKKIWSERSKIWRKKNPEKVKATKLRYYYRHRERDRERLRPKRRAYYQRPEVKKRIAEQSKAWHKNNPEKVREKSKRWALKNRHKIRIYAASGTQKRRAFKLGNTINPVAINKFVRGIRATKQVACYYCKNKTAGKTAHIDHIVPLSKGGAHSVTNLCASCPSCNQHKHDKLIQDWMRLGQQVLAL
jgi:5-methylcytosine-specific restriction endonuclease McrA